MRGGSRMHRGWEVGSTIGPLIISSVIHPLWGPGPTGSARSSGPYGKIRRVRADLIPGARCCKGLEPQQRSGFCQPEFLDQWDLQHASSVYVCGAALSHWVTWFSSRGPMLCRAV